MNKKDAVRIVCDETLQTIRRNPNNADEIDVKTLSAIVTLSHDKYRYVGYFIAIAEELLINADSSNAVPLLDEISKLKQSHDECYKL